MFLDKKRQYSCAYFKNENDTLETAQENKIDHIIKKLHIQPNQKVLDIGSGWGTLAIDIAKKTKASVTGITLSENQLKYSQEKAKELNLDNQVEFKLIDYRQLNEKFDRIVSVGMFEHVGKKFYQTYFNIVSKMLKKDGVALIHTIGSNLPPRDPQPWITKYIFPGGYTPSLSEIARPIEDSGLIATDIEILRFISYQHLLWIIIIPPAASFCYQLDGIFIGASQTKEIRNAMIVSVIGFIATSIYLTNYFENHGLWFSLMLFMILRSLTLKFYFNKILRKF